MEVLLLKRNLKGKEKAERQGFSVPGSGTHRQLKYRKNGETERCGVSSLK